eukprot:TRINITY_DN42149_c0_g1_i1.p1 TRINITY_DN42149_c0_g1~~TRINITY_DN42149_c0_g1_i1.p1  ORF type:complete len:112 (-),score=7.71 TRINITY_DN42149_c0_g1_i1:22-357(-)
MSGKQGEDSPASFTLQVHRTTSAQSTQAISPRQDVLDISIPGTPVSHRSELSTASVSSAGAGKRPRQQATLQDTGREGSDVSIPELAQDKEDQQKQGSDSSSADERRGMLT